MNSVIHGFKGNIAARKQPSGLQDDSSEIFSHLNRTDPMGLGEKISKNKNSDRKIRCCKGRIIMTEKKPEKESFQQSIGKVLVKITIINDLSQWLKIRIIKPTE